jgi:type IV pilus assembly protein PilQ
MTLKAKITALWITILATVLIGPAIGSAPTNTSLQTPISLQFSDIELTELLQILAKLGGTNFFK